VPKLCTAANSPNASPAVPQEPKTRRRRARPSHMADGGPGGDESWRYADDPRLVGFTLT
jgi:hypothetical protein